MLRRVGAIGDIHAEDESLARVLAFFQARSVERILAVGDIADGPGDVERCCQLLADAGADVVRGNHDRWAVTGKMRQLANATAVGSARAFLESLPATREYATSAGALMLCHGLGSDDMNRLTPDDHGYAIEVNDVLQRLIRMSPYRLVVNGHTHRRMVRTFGDDLTVINVGTLARDHDPVFATIDFDDRRVQFYNLSSDRDISRAERCSF